MAMTSFSALAVSVAAFPVLIPPFLFSIQVPVAVSTPPPFPTLGTWFPVSSELNSTLLLLVVFSSCWGWFFYRVEAGELGDDATNRFLNFGLISLTLLYLQMRGFRTAGLSSVSGAMGVSILDIE